MKLGRNDPCHCGSGNKYKKCCLPKDEAATSAKLAAEAAERQAEAERLAKEAEENPPEPTAAGRDQSRATPGAKSGAKPAKAATSSTAPPLRRRRASV
jgi:hypothetical protein